MTLRCVSPFCLYLSLYNYVIHTTGAQSDMLMWLMSEAKGVERSLEGWARRLLNLNFTSVQTTSLVSLQRSPFLSSLFDRLLTTHRRRRSHSHSTAC
jgi:hypothetical protein